MKIRTGFVSNSSSTSFCIYGISMDTYELQEILENKGVPGKYFAVGLYEYLDEWSFMYELKNKGMSEEEAQQEADKRLLTEFEFYNPCGEESAYIGTSWSKIGDDETGSQFKQKIETKLKAIIGEDIKCSTIVEAWREG